MLQTQSDSYGSFQKSDLMLLMSTWNLQMDGSLMAYEGKAEKRCNTFQVGYVTCKAES